MQGFEPMSCQPAQSLQAHLRQDPVSGIYSLTQGESNLLLPQRNTEVEWTLPSIINQIALHCNNTITGSSIVAFLNIFAHFAIGNALK